VIFKENFFAMQKREKDARARKKREKEADLCYVLIFIGTT
jgi:hypothetical protein